MRSRAGALALVVVVVAAGFGAAACTGTDPYDALERPDPVEIEETTTTSEADLTGVPLAPVIGSTTTSVAIGPGPVTIVGHVEGPDGVVPGAIVQLERLVGDGSASMRVPTAPDGTWNASNVLGGRYRVRAWRAPDLASARPSIVFVDGSEGQQAIDLRVEPVGGVRVDVAVAPDPPIVGEEINLKVRVAERSVDAEGVVRDTPTPGVSVALGGSGDWAVGSPNPSTTGTDGSTIFRLTCGDEGAQPLFATIDRGESYALAIQPCVDPTASTTTTTSSPDDDGSPSSTSTSSSTSSSTTSTTEA